MTTPTANLNQTIAAEAEKHPEARMLRIRIDAKRGENGRLLIPDAPPGYAVTSWALEAEGKLLVVAERMRPVPRGRSKAERRAAARGGAL